MRRSKSIRLTLLPLLASASLAAAQQPPLPQVPPSARWEDAPPLDPGWSEPDREGLLPLDADGYVSLDPADYRPHPDEPSFAEFSFIVVPTVRGGFGAFVFSSHS